MARISPDLIGLEQVVLRDLEDRTTHEQTSRRLVTRVRPGIPPAARAEDGYQSGAAVGTSTVHGRLHIAPNVELL